MKLIDADELIKKIKKEGLLGSGFSDSERESDAIEMIEECDAIDAKPVRYGHWVLKTDELGDEYTMCSNCMVEFKFKGTDGEMIYLDMKNTHYCPYCGAKNG